MTFIVLQVICRTPPAHAMRRFLETAIDDEIDFFAAYENQSGGVIVILDKLRDKFIEERTQFQTEERSEFKAQPIKANADATGDLQDTTSTCDEAFSVV